MSEFIVLTVKQQKILSKHLLKANDALLAINAIIANDPAAPKARKARKPKVETPVPAKRGRPAKAKVEEPATDL